MTYYSRKIEMPNTRLQGLCNFVQMVINAIESEQYQSALLTAVDLLDTLEGQANPFSSITSEKDNAMLTELKRQYAQEMVDAISKARADGVEAGIAAEKDRMAKALGLVVT